MIRALLVLGALSLGACSSRAPAPPATSTTGTPTMQAIELKLLVEPTTLAMSARKSFMVGLSITNRGSAPIDPKAWDAALFVNDDRAPAWDLAVQNGPRDPKWDSLPPGDTISMSWPLGEALFEKPGDYNLVLELGGQRVASRVTVTP